MKNKNKRTMIAIELTVLALFVSMFVVFLILELAVPDSVVSIWIRDNIWNIRETAATLKNHVPTLITCLIYIILVYAICRLVRVFFKVQMQKSDRRKSVYALLDGFVKYASAIAIIMLVLKACGVDTTALIASVGVLTLVVGLGAQPLIADIIAGIFIIFENEYNVGEIVSINDFRGKVVEIGIRSTKLLDAAGNIKIINNNNVGDVVNLSREPSLAVVECDFPYDVPLEKIENLLNKNLERIKKNVPDIIEGPYYKGVTEYKDSNVTIKIVASCDEENRFQVERDLLREYRIILVENNIDISYPQVVLNFNEKKEEEKLTAKNKRDASKFLDEQREESHNLDSQDK